MRAHNIQAFLRLLGVKKIELSADAEWIKSSCPKAEFSHPKGSDRHPSFGVKVNNEGESSVNCFTCGGDTLGGLLHSITWQKGYRPELHSFYGANEIFGSEINKYAQIDFTPGTKEKPLPVPHKILESFPLLEMNPKYSGHVQFETEKVLSWFEDRGISFEILKEYRLRLDVMGGNIVFPIRDVDYKTYMLHARSRSNKIFFYYTPEYLSSPVKWGRTDFWFGIEYTDFTKPLLLVESETDVLKLRTFGVENVMASCGSVGPDKLKRIVAGSVILGFDSDESGARYCKKAISELHSSAYLSRISWQTVGKKDACALKDKSEWAVVWANRKAVSMKGGEIIVGSKKIKEYPERY